MTEEKQESQEPTSHTDKGGIKKDKAKDGTIFMLTLTLFAFFWIVTNFLVGFLLALAGGFVLYKKQDIILQKPKLMPWAFVGLIALILIASLMSAAQSDKEMREERDEITSGEAENYEYITEAGTIERDIELEALKVLGHETEIRRIAFERDVLWVNYVAQENLTTNLTVTGIHKEGVEIVENISPMLDSNVNLINIFAYMPLVDQYGEETIENVSRIQITRDTWEKINWENFLSDDIPDIADDYWLHPALTE